MVISFDIFDTCLIRKCGDPHLVFWMIGRKIFGSNTTLADMYYFWRCEAEQKAKSLSGKETVSLRDILKCAPEWLKQYEDTLYDEELCMEKDMLGPVVNTAKKIQECRESGYNIIFISDMYLPSSFLAGILGEFGMFMPGDKILVSCEYGKTKQKGDLFRLAQGEVNDIIKNHYGDNLLSDYRMSRKNGIKPIHVNTGYNEVEKHFMCSFDCSKFAREIRCLVGLFRYARLTSTNPSECGIAADFVAPIWISYCYDILSKARDEGMERLYFLARDGYILKWTSEILHPLFPTVDIRYLYVSRKSMFLPSITRWDRTELKQYWGGSFKYVSDALLEKYFKVKMAESKLQIENDAIEARKRIDSYFEQEGVYDDNTEYALVDVGWKGSGRVAFNKLQQLHGCKPREMWYWGTFANYRNSYDGIFYTYNPNMPLPLYFISLIEDVFSTSPEMSTIDYVLKDGRWNPVFDEASVIDNSSVLEYNKHCIATVSSFIIKYNLTDRYLLNLISDMATKVLLHSPDLLDLSTLVKINSFSENSDSGVGKGIVKKATLHGTFTYVLGKNWSGGWCEGDLAYTYGSFSKHIIKIHNFNRKLINKILR